jgi:hypothetical protein
VLPIAIVTCAMSHAVIQLRMTTDGMTQQCIVNLFMHFKHLATCVQLQYKAADGTAAAPCHGWTCMLEAVANVVPI